MTTGSISIYDLPQSSWERENAQRIKDTEKHNREVLAYFERLGYTTGWDHRNGLYWHEIYAPRKGGLVCQIDGGVSLKSIRQDFTDWHEGRESSTGEDYTVSGGIDSDGKMTSAFKRLLKKVAETAP